VLEAWNKHVHDELIFTRFWGGDLWGSLISDQGVREKHAYCKLPDLLRALNNGDFEFSAASARVCWILGFKFRPTCVTIMDSVVELTRFRAKFFVTFICTKKALKALKSVVNFRTHGVKCIGSKVVET